MDVQQLWAADEERVGKNPLAPTPFDLDDDAFADGDDNDPNYKFSSITIRAELARAISSHEIPTSIEKSLDADAARETSEPHAGISGSLLVRMPAYPSALISPSLQRRLGPPSRRQSDLC